jgi:hypothetical protein
LPDQRCDGSKGDIVEEPVLERGDLVPHFTITRIDGRTFSYSTVWQHSNLVLIALPGGESSAAMRYVSELAARLSGPDAQDFECVVTRDRVSGVRPPAVVVVDRWGEVVHAAAAPTVEELPPPGELAEWVSFVRNRCPECEGEAR